MCGDRFKLIIYFVIGFLILVLAAGTSTAIYTIQEFGTDSFRYVNGTDITASGKLMNDTSGEYGVNISVEFSNATGTVLSSLTTTTDVNGAFSVSIPTNQTGSFMITAYAPDLGLASPSVNVVVNEIDSIKYAYASFTTGIVYAVSLNESGYGNATINGTGYDFYVSTDNTASIVGGSITLNNVVLNSRVVLGGNTYSVFFINRTGEIVLAGLTQPIFTGNEGQETLTVLTLDPLNRPLSGRNLTLQISSGAGVIETLDPSPTNANGLTSSIINITNTSGIYNIQILENDQPLGSITYSVNSYDVSADVLSSDWSPQHTFARGQTAKLSASVKTTAGSILNDTQAGVTANIRGPGGISDHVTMLFDVNRSLFYYDYNISESFATGTYNVEYLTAIGSEILKNYGNFEVRGYNLLIKPVGNQVKDLEGFSPGVSGYLLVSGTDLGTGDIANVNVLTGDSNRSNFTLSITDRNGKDATGFWDVMPLETFFSDNFVPDWLQDEIRSIAPNASVINFTVPASTGIYNVEVTVNLEGSLEDTRTSIGVQDIFINAFPVSNDGLFAMSVSSRDNVTLSIRAFNPKEMREENNITDAGIIEAFAVDAGQVVTDKMESFSLVNLPGGSKGLRFYNNDTNNGFHMVKFWANVTKSDGSSVQAIGTGFFDVKQYLIWASPALTETGDFQTFSATSDISIRVQVFNTGFSPQSGKQVSIDEVRFGQNWEKVDFDSVNSSNISGTTDSNGIANLSFIPLNPLKSGWYDVRIKLTTQDAAGNYITDFGRGWFEVRNFMFFAFPVNWNVKSGENIAFNLKTVNSSDPGSAMNTSISVGKLLYRSDWNQPSKEVAGNHTLNGSSSVQISTNVSTEETVVYTGNATTKAGIYEFIFEASDPETGAVEEAHAFIETRPFVSWVTLPGGQWNNNFGVNRTINLIVMAGDNYGDSNHLLNPNRTNITSVTKMGMFGGTPFKKRSDLNITSVVQDIGFPNAVNITLTLTGWEEGSYDMQINAVDDAGNEVLTHFWIDVEIATVGLPQFYMVMIPGDMTVSRRTSFYLSDTPAEKVGDMQYPNLTNDVANNFTNAKVGVKTILENDNDAPQWGLMPGDTRSFYMLINLTEPRKLYINFQDANFLDNNASYTQNVSEGEIFNELDADGNVVRHWNVTSIGADGSVVLDGIDALKNTYIIDPSISKSGLFIAWPNMEDAQWLNIDLDGNGDFFRQWNNRNNTYYVLLADNTTAGIYDTVWVSNTTNFTKDGIRASDSNTPVSFGGDPIYFINLRKEAQNFIMQFTSYSTGFSGMFLGTFEKGKPVNIPFLVQEPGSTEGIAGANVTVNRLTGNLPGSKLAISPVSATTNTHGLAMVELNTTDIPTGEYLIGYRVDLPGGKVKEATETWKMPGLEIRKFIVQAEFGNVGTIPTEFITNGSGLEVLFGTRIDPKGVTSAYQWGPNPMIYRVAWPFDMENQYIYNATDGNYYTGFDGQNTTGLISSSSINLTHQGSNTTYNFTQFIPAGTNESITGTVPKTVFGYWNISLWNDFSIGTDWRGLYAGLRINYLLDNTQDLRENLPEENKHGVGDQIFWGPGELDIQITAIDQPNNTVYFETIRPKILYQTVSLDMLIDGNLSNGEWESGGVTKLAYRGYDVYGYNDVEQTALESAQYGPPYCMGCYTPTQDHVLLVNGSSSFLYRVGTPIPELDNEYAGLVSEWASKIIFVNQTQGLGTFPFSDWAPDGDSYYMGTFSESDVKADLNNNGTTNDNWTYYIKLSDQSKNGVFNVTDGIFDDDTDFTEAWTNSPNYTGPLDLFGVEQGQVVDPMRNTRLEERHVTLGELLGWPFGVPVITYNGNYANLTTFNQRFEPFGTTENVTMYLSVKTFSDVPIDGNVSLENLVVLFKANQSTVSGSGMGGGTGPGTGKGFTGTQAGGPVPGGEVGVSAPVVYSNISIISPIAGGIGIWMINYDQIAPVVGSFDTAQFIAVLNITDQEGNFETVERQFMIQNRSAFGKAEYGCPPPPSPCGGGTGGGGGEIPPTPTPGPTPPPGNISTNGTEVWNRTFGGPGFDAAYSVAKNPEGYVLAGQSSAGLDPGDALLVITDANGTQLFFKTFGGAGLDKANHVRTLTDGYILAGITGSNGVSDDAWLIRTDASGNEIWNRTYGGSGFEEAKAVRKVADGYVFTGTTSSYGNGAEDVWLVKTDFNGTELWNRTFGGVNNDTGEAISEIPGGGGLVIAGTTDSFGAGNGDAWLIKTDSNGTMQWNRTFGGTEADAVYSVNILSMNLTQGIVLAGETSSFGSLNGSAWLIASDINGSELWNRTYAGPGRTYARSLEQTGTGFLLAGAGFSGPTSDALLIKTGFDGALQWHRTYGGPGDDIAYGIAINPGSIILGGSTDSYGSGNDDAWLIFIGGS